MQPFHLHISVYECGSLQQNSATLIYLGGKTQKITRKYLHKCVQSCFKVLWQQKQKSPKVGALASSKYRFSSGTLGQLQLLL